MSFQGYLTTIKAKTGKGPEDFRNSPQRKTSPMARASRKASKQAILWRGSSKILRLGMGTPWRSTPYSRASNPKTAR